MEKMGKLRTQEHNWKHTMIIGFLYYVMVGESEALVNKIEVLVNDMVSLHCHTKASIDIQWHFNSLLSYVFAGGKLRYPYNERVRTEDDNAGSYTLIIPKVRSEDAGWWYCQEEISGRLINSTHVTVLHSHPICYSNMHLDGFIGPNTCNLQQENMVFDCVVSFNGTSPHLTWRSLNDNRTLNSSICEDKPNRRNCSLNLTSDPKYDGSTFICQTTASIDSRFNCSTETVKILHFSSRKHSTVKYVSDNVSCTVDSNINVKYNWTLDQKNQVSVLSAKQNLLIQNPGIYQCEVNYSIRNYSCLSIASVIYASVESINGGTTSGTTTLVIILSIGLVFAVLFIGMFVFIRKHRKRTRIENERIRNKIEGMRKDFVLDVDPEDVLKPLIQKRIISNDDRANVLNKETTEDNCRALLGHLFSSSHREAFIVLKEAISDWYPSIAARIDASDNSPVIRIPENERVKDKVISMYIDFISNVDPKDVCDLLMQRRIIDLDEKQMMIGKDTVKESCRALIDHLFLHCKKNAFIILRHALKEHYLEIVERIDASDADNEADDGTVTDEAIHENERIRNRVVAIYEDFVSEVDPKKKVLDFLIQNKIVNIKQGHHLKNKVTVEEQCEALLDLLYSCSRDNVFIILKEALKEHYPGIVERIDSLTIDDEDQNNPNPRISTIRFESSIVVFEEDRSRQRENDAFKVNLNRPDDVSALQQLPIETIPYMAAAVYCGSVFVTGIGKDNDEIWRFNERYSKWNKCDSLIKGRLSQSAAFVDHILYIFGGCRSHHDAFDDVEAYDAIDDKCSVVGKLNYAVKDGGMCVPYKSLIYIFGGKNAHNDHVNSVQVYNTKFNSCTLLKNPMPTAEVFLRAALIKHYIILLGEKTCFFFNFETKSWEVRNQFKTGFQRFGMTVHNEKLFVIGGKDSNGIRRDDVRYVPISNIFNDEHIEWQHHAKLPKPFQVSSFGKLEFLIQI